MNYNMPGKALTIIINMLGFVPGCLGCLPLHVCYLVYLYIHCLV